MPLSEISVATVDGDQCSLDARLYHLIPSKQEKGKTVMKKLTRLISELWLPGRVQTDIVSNRAITLYV